MRIIGAGAPAGEERTARSEILTWANLITLLRLLGLPLFMWLVLSAELHGLAFIVLVIIGGTDWVDGYLARKLDQVSHVGVALDPIVDRLMIVVVAITFALAFVAPWWLVVTILLPDLSLGIVALIRFRGNPGIPASLLGKVRTALLMAGLPLMLISGAMGAAYSVLHSVGVILTALGCIGHWIAASQYMHLMFQMPVRKKIPHERRSG